MNILKKNYLIGLLSGLLLIIIIIDQNIVNHIAINYKSIGFLLMPIGFLLFAQAFKNSSILTHNFCMSQVYASLILPLMGLAPYLIPYSSHEVIDPTLKLLDSMMFFNVANFMSWFQVHPILNDFFWHIYNLFLPQILLTFLVLPFFDFEGVQKFYIWTLMTFIIMMVFTYFYPSVSPCYSYHGFNFSKSLTKEADQFILIKNHLSHISITDDVSCPSYHVVMALCIIHSWINIRRFFINKIIIVINILMIISTLTTGSHYLTDVIAGIILFYSCFLMLNTLEKK